MIYDLVIQIPAVVAATLLALAISRHYYHKAGSELRAEAARLCKTRELILYAFMNRDAEKPRLDTKGDVVGIVVSATGSPKLDAR